MKSLSLNTILVVGFAVVAAFIIIIYRLHVSSHGGWVGHF
jgi:hypothetical protein